MKKVVLCISFILIWSMLLIGCKEKTETDMELIQRSIAVKIETSNGDVKIVQNALMREFVSLRIQPTSADAITEEDNWIYRFTYDPVEKVVNSKEAVVTFYSSYVKVGDEFYVPEEDLEYSEILDWAKMYVKRYIEQEEKGD